jgi:hypothetical protein
MKSMKMKVKKLIGYCIIVFFCFACNIKNAGIIEGPVVYNPTFSFPVGYYNLLFENIFTNMDLPQGDTAGADSLYLVWVEDQFYKDTIGHYDTTIVVNFNFNFLENNRETIKSILFRINYLSELPSESYLQVYFDGPAGNRMDSLFLDGPLLLEPADTNNQGFVENAHTNQRDVFFDDSRFDMLLETTQLELQVGIQTRRNDIEYFKYLESYKLYIQMGIRVELEAVFE